MVMSRVDFYHDADDKFTVAARLAQKAVTAGLRLLISTPDAETANLIDRVLWTFSPPSFVPHARTNTPLDRESPVVIACEPLSKHTQTYDVLINLGNTLPDTTEGFDRIIEIVSRNDTDKSLARTRFRAYRELGCELVAHQLGNAE